MIVDFTKAAMHIGQVVTVEGFIHLVHRSGRGTYFIKFEKTPRPFDGFKLVLFNQYVPVWTNAGIDPREYQQKRLRVRGLVQDHPEWGLEIIVNRPEMISIVDGKAAQSTSPSPQKVDWRS